MAKYEQGVYVCEITGQGFDESKEKKTPFFWIEFKPLGRINPEDPEGQLYGCDEYLRTVKMYLTPNTEARVRERLTLLGWTSGRFQDLEPGGACSFIGREVNLECGHEQSGDKVYEKWDFPFEGGSEARHETGVARKLDALFGKATKPAAASRTTRAPSARAPAPKPEPVAAGANSAPPSDDIPF